MKGGTNMILAVRKSDGAVFEVVGCDGLYPISILEDLSGKQFYEKDSNLRLIFDDNSDFEKYLRERV